MLAGMKDIFKMVEIIVISACAVFISALFLNYNLDLERIEPLMHTEEMRAFYDALIMTGKVVIGLCGGSLLLTSGLVLCFYIKHYMDSHHSELGILKAMGYARVRTAGRFWVFGLSVLAGTGIGYLGACCIMPLFYSTQNRERLIPEVEMHFQPLVPVCLVLLPTLFFVLLSVAYSYRKLGMPVMELLRGKGIQKARLSKDAGDIPFLKELRKNTLRQRRSLVFFIGFSALCFSSTMQMALSMEEMSSWLMSALMLLVGVILACVTLLLSVTTVVRANRKTLAMMRAFGYAREECAGAILGGYRPVACIGFGIGTVYQYGLLKVMVNLVFQDVANVPEYHFNVPAFFIALAGFAVLYESVMYGYARTIDKMSVKEIMLDTE